MPRPIPAKLELLEDKGKLIIRRTWRGYHLIFLVFFSLIWDSFLIFFFLQLSKESTVPTFVFLFPLIHVLVGIGISYYTFISFFNQTDIRINADQVEIKSHPYKWLGDKIIPVSIIQQLYVKENITRSKNGTHVSYSVNLIDHFNKEQKLISGLPDDQARFIEKTIEETLCIPDQLIDGEFK